MLNRNLLAVGFFLYASTLGISFSASDYRPHDVLTRDFLVLGGGASGTYAAGQYVTSAFVNFRKGQIVPTPYTLNVTTLLAYFESLARFPYLSTGFDLPDPVPDDLLLPLGHYLAKYGLEDIAYFFFQNAPCQGNILDQTTLYVAKYYGLVNKASIINGYLSSARNNNSELYSAAQDFLGSNVFLRSHVVSLRRTENGVTAVVSTPSGNKLIKAKKLISSISPKLDTGNLAGWDLGAKERNIFGQFNSSAYWTSLVTNTGLNNSVVWANSDPDQVQGLARLPQAYVIYPTGTIKDVFHVYYGSPYYMSDKDVKRDIVAEVKRVQVAAGVPVTEPEFLIFDSHTPFQCTVGVDAIRNGFYKALYSMQGEKSTFWTGAAFHTHDSSLLWQWTETLLPIWMA
ncbi:amine oxidase flavin-containing superfamily [Thozetella sp. PMI_491]|nr:amine oxidase flavin-containing superfamily [Thozetella sp. PMI_491]